MSESIDCRIDSRLLLTHGDFDPHTLRLNTSELSGPSPSGRRGLLTNVTTNKHFLGGSFAAMVVPCLHLN
jgi:hypothetical protein